jgi:prepilin-type N-terminal cleavage/methylation domain-containing protein
MPTSFRKDAGFTLIEMLVSVAVVSALATMSVPQTWEMLSTWPSAQLKAVQLKTAQSKTAATTVNELEHFVTRLAGRKGPVSARESKSSYLRIGTPVANTATSG